MNSHNNELRKKAQSILKQNPEKLTQFQIDNINEIMEELNIYQVELELQNDELRSTQIKLEETKNEYIDLFESSSNGYAMINEEFLIVNCNETFAKIVNLSKSKIINQSFTHFIHPDFQDTAYICFNSVFTNKMNSKCEVKMLCNENYPKYFRIDSKLDAANNKLARLSIIDINKEKEHELELAFNSRLLEQIEDAIISVDSVGNIKYFNKKAEYFTAYQQKDALHSNIEEVLKIYHPQNDLHEYTPLNFFKQLINKKSEVAKCININGEEYFLEFSVTAAKKQNSDHFDYLVLFRNKTEEYINQMMLDVRIELLNYSVDHNLDELLVKAIDEVEMLTQSKIGFYHFIAKDQKTIQLQEWSTSTKKYFCKADAKGMNYQIDAAGVWADALRKKQAVIHNDYEKMPYKKGLPEGHAGIIREMVVPVMRNNEVVAILGVGNKKSDYTHYDTHRLEYIADVTWEIVQQKKTAEELKKSKDFLENIFNAIQNGINVVDKNLNIVAANKWVQNIFSSHESLIGKPCFKSFKGNQSICNNCPAHKTLTDKKPHTDIVEFVEKGLDSRYFEITTFPVLDENNEIRSIIEYIKDDTDRQLMEKELLHTNEELKIAKQKAEESDRLKSAFLANMSHEIRTPMNGILGFAEILKEPDLSVEEHQQFLSVIERSGERMLNIINDLIDISKIEADLMDINISEVNINDQLEYLYAFFKPETTKKGLKLQYKSDPQNTNIMVQTDKDKFLAIFINLIKNAIKYTHQGEINFGYTIIGDKIEFYVQDTGLGIEKSSQDKIFDRFVQVDLALTSKYEGAGLGLAITKGYLKLLGGDIRLESEYRKGSKFYFHLPYKN